MLSCGLSGLSTGTPEISSAKAVLAFLLKHVAVAVTLDSKPISDGTFASPSPSSFPLRESIEAFVSDNTHLREDFSCRR